MSLAGGEVTWAQAMTWADSLVYQGYDDWRLPNSPGTRQGYWFNEGEMGYLYFTELGNPLGSVLEGPAPRINSGQPPFTNPPTNEIFWLSAPPIHPGSAWSFQFQNGFQNAGSDTDGHSAWAVRDGDSVAVPEPSTWVMGAVGIACGGWQMFRRRRAR